MRWLREFVRNCLISSIAVLFAATALSGMAISQELDVPLPDGTAEEAGTEGEEPEQVNVEEVIKQGEEALAAKEYEKALEIYTKLQQGLQQSLEHRQFLPIAWTGLGRALAGLQEYQAAEELFRQAIEGSENFIDAYLARGEMYLDMGAPANALPDFEKAVELDRTNLRGQFGLGKTYTLGQAYPQAIGPLTRVIAVQPEHAEAYRLRGTSYVGSFQTEKGIADLQQAISINPNDHENHFMLGVAYLRDEKYSESVESFSRAISNYVPKPGEEDQPYLQGYLTRASAYIEMGKNAEEVAAKREAYQKALEDAEYLLGELDERSPITAGARAAALFSRGVAERMLGDFGKAVQSFSDAINLNPEMAEAYFRRGICFHNMGETKMAIADFAQAGDLQFEDPRANFWEGLMHAKLGDYHEALRAYGDALAASDRYEPAYYNRGLAYLMLGENEKAIRDFNHAIRIEPSRAEYYFQRGVAQRRMGDIEAASASFANAIEFEDNYIAAYRHMADVMEEMGRAELAREYREKADQLAPPPEQQSAQ